MRGRLGKHLSTTKIGGEHYNGSVLTLLPYTGLPDWMFADCAHGLISRQHGDVFV